MAAALGTIPLFANRLRVPLASYLSDRLARPVAIRGDLRIESALPLVIAGSDISIGSGSNPEGPELLHVKRMELELEPLSLLRGQVVVPRVRAVGPSLTLERDFAGRVNWRRGRPSSRATHPPQIGSLQIAEGHIVYHDAILAIDAELTFESDAQPQSEAGFPLRFEGSGTLAEMPFRLEGQAGNPLSLVQPGTPYNVDAVATAKHASGSFSGTLAPLDWNTIDGRFVLQGNDLSKMLNIPSLRRTPGYRLEGQLARKDNVWHFDDVHFRVGHSDLRGKLSLQRLHDRSTIVADIRSTQLDLRDIGVLTGPRGVGASSAAIAPRGDTPDAPPADAKVLSSRPYDPKRLRRSDVDLRFRGERVLVRKLVLEHMTTHVSLDRGKLSMDPLDFELAGGRVSARMSFDARGESINSALNVTAHDVRVMALLPALASKHGSQGKMSGRVTLRSTGNSVAQTMAAANGTIDLHASKGQVSALALVLTDLDLGKAAQLVLFGDQAAQVSCMAASAQLKDGTLVANHLLVDSSEASIVGTGSIDFRDERYDLRVKAAAKRPSIAKLRSPIVVEGTFRQPKVHPEVAPVAARAAAAIALGILVTPAAALVPLIDIGETKDSGCQALAAEMARQDDASTDSKSRSR